MMPSLIRLFALLALLASAPVAAELRAWLDRSEIALGETVTLNIEVQGAGAAAPDYRPLDADFERRGSSSSSQISLVNAQRSATTLFAVTLRPRREGELEVPALEVGAERSPPLALRVGPAPVDSGGGELFLEASLSSAEIYVQEQAIYALKLFFAVNLWDGQLEAALADGVQGYRLGDDLKYQVERGGRRYQVIERRFALVAERSGEIELAAPSFEGSGLNRGSYGGLLGAPGVRLAARGPALTLRVRPRPAAAAEPWLPARSLSLELGGEPLPDSVRVGEPLSLSLLLRASGLLPAQLPELSLPDIDGAAVYPDQPGSRDASGADGLAGERSRRVAIVPQRPGSLQIPALRIPWWDTEADVQRWAELPARQIEVLPGVAAGAEAPADAAALASADEALAPAPTSFAGWPAVLGAALAGLSVGWWLGRRPRFLPASPAGSAAAPPAPSGPAQRLVEALRAGDLAAIARALRAAAPAAGSPAGQLDDPRQRQAAEALERFLFAADTGADAELLQERLREAFARRPRWRGKPTQRAAGASPFPSLYG